MTAEEAAAWAPVEAWDEGIMDARRKAARKSAVKRARRGAGWNKSRFGLL
jgi:hypothetical protein